MRSRIRCELSKVDKLVLNDHVGESDDRSVRPEKVLQQAEKNSDSTTQKVSEIRKERKSLQVMMMMRPSAHCIKANEVSVGRTTKEVIVQNIKIVERQCRRSRRSGRLRYTSCNSLFRVDVQSSRNDECR